MIKMGRKSIASKILEELPEMDVLDQAYIVAYDFHGGPPHPRFYSSLHSITGLTGDGSTLTQYSVYRTKSLKAALAVHTLAIRDGAEVQLYEVAETSPEELLEKLREAQELLVLEDVLPEPGVLEALRAQLKDQGLASFNTENEP